MTKKKGVRRVVKAWAIYHKRHDDIASQVYTTKAKAIDDLRDHSYSSDPLVMRDVLKFYKVIPCTITYTLPTKIGKK